jgi:hypothetical protein
VTRKGEFHEAEVKPISQENCYLAAPPASQIPRAIFVTLRRLCYFALLNVSFVFL